MFLKFGRCLPAIEYFPQTFEKNRLLVLLVLSYQFLDSSNKCAKFVPVTV